MFNKDKDNRIQELEKNVSKLTSKLQEADNTVTELRHILEKKNQEIKEVNWNMSTMKREYELKVDERLSALKKEMSESLIKSDIMRTEAVAKLEVFEKIDTKADANAIKDMIGKLIEALGKHPETKVNVVK